MNTRKNIAAVLGVGALMVAGIATIGSTPAKADGLQLSFVNGRISVGYTQDTCYTPTYYVAPVNSYHNDVRQDDRDNQGSNWNSDRRGDDGQNFARDDAKNFGKDRRGNDSGQRGQTKGGDRR